MSNRKRSFVERLIAQWPGALGVILVGLGLLIIWEVHQGGRNSGSREGLLFIVMGIVALGYWSFADRNDDYNF